MPSAWSILSQVIGVAYVATWSCSFYPQVILNYQNKSTKGLSPFFAAFNPLGFLCVTVFNTALFFVPVVRDQYARRHHGGTPSQSPADIAFAWHALLLSSICFVQTRYYRRSPDQRLSTPSKILLPALFAAVAGYGLYIWASHLPILKWLYLLSYVKIGITSIKYIPQAYLNFQRGSTQGWSVVNIWLDLSGGLLSFAQLLLDSWLAGDLAGGTFGNPSKLAMGLLSIFFDLLFLVQHYILYRHASPAATVKEPDERAPLLEDGRRADQGQGSREESA